MNEEQAIKIAECYIQIKRVKTDTAGNDHAITKGGYRCNFNSGTEREMLDLAASCKRILVGQLTRGYVPNGVARYISENKHLQ